MTVRQVPAQLVPNELEREFLAAAFRAGDVLEETPDSELAAHVLEVLRGFDPEDLVYREHRRILLAVHEVFDMYATITPALVKDELQRRRQFDALRCLPSVAFYTWAIFRSIEIHASRLRGAAGKRREWLAADDAQRIIAEAGEVWAE